MALSKFDSKYNEIILKIQESRGVDMVFIEMLGRGSYGEVWAVKLRRAGVTDDRAEEFTVAVKIVSRQQSIYYRVRWSF